ncbi:MAG: serine/threonine protein kinase [Myxococcales bacterium]|nr:serine/threonine protein kinase [Myxococcales bacterium]
MSFLQPGSVFGKDFRIIRHLSSGGMGSVFVVEQLSTGKERALKVMHTEFSTDEAHRTRFESEARVSASIESDHVVEVLAAGVDAESNIPWLVMELLRGETLDDHVTHRGPMTISAVRECAKQLRHALEQAHLLGLVHRDLKPENLFLASARREDVPFTLKILDFGIAKWAQEAKGTLKNSQMLGSPLWMAPEQLQTGALISPATDVWALGLIAYFLLTGTHYWATANSPDPSITGLLIEIASSPMTPPSERAAQFAPRSPVPEGFDAWFARTTHRTMSARFEHAGPCLEAFIALIEEAQGAAATTLPIIPRAEPSFGASLTGAEDPEMLLRIARVYELRDTDRPRAVEAYRRVLSVAPRSREAFDALCTLLESMSRWDELATLLADEAAAARANATGRVAAALWLRLAAVRRAHLADPEGEHQALLAAFDAEPLNRAVTAALVTSLAARGDFPGVEALLARARSAGQTGRFLDELAGDAASARGDLASAEAAYGRAVVDDVGDVAPANESELALLAKLARVSGGTGSTAAAEVRARWTRVLEVDLMHAEAWAALLALLGEKGSPTDLRMVADAAVTTLGDAAPPSAREVLGKPAPKAAPLSIHTDILRALADGELGDAEATRAEVAAAPPRRPLASFGLSLKELVDPMTSSRALLTKAMPIYRQLSAASAALDLTSSRKVYFKEGQGGFQRLWSEPPTVVIGADIAAWTPDEITFAAFELLAGTRPELELHLAFQQLTSPSEPSEGARRYLVAAERVAARLGLLAARSLLAAARPLAARGGPHVLAATALQAELALFVASGAAAKILAQALDG